MLDHLITNTRIGESPAMNNTGAVAELFGWLGGTQYITGVAADYSAAVAAVKTLIFKKGAGIEKTGPLVATALAIGSTDTNVASTIFSYAIAETTYTKAAVAAGTALAAGTIPADKWGIYLLSINAAGTIAVTAGAAFRARRRHST